ncbi:Di-copper centre-containing protein [Lojkania enalia]|uniref:tyrosinase n=1 Tax=Lojkania enalia TaxID=147567 RepID=A0A9P4TPH8_9PLEO|nr:Di-copper centre-containing protein [Didymosphaeria enalia]
MERFKAKSKTDRMGYYQIAGVHGRPFQSWNNFPTPLVNNAGFCPHAMTLFGSWHRPYLAVYEQAWYQSVQEVIATFPSSQQLRWRNAAATLRMPYWDWAVAPPNGESNIPTLIRDQRVTVTKPSGRVTIDNPLYSYSFGSSLPPEMGGGPWNNWPITLRRPVSNPTRSNNNEVSARMQSIRISLRDRIFNIFQSRQSWGYASTSQIGARIGNGVDSFESIHDAVHSTVGGESGGTMYYLDYSAFDPIFWLHHCNIDRLLAMYQLVVPNTYVANGNVNRPMAQWNTGEGKNGNTPLKPFTKNTNGDYFTSFDVRETRALGYYYPETQARTASQVNAAVQRLYSRTATATARRKRSVTGQYEGHELKDGDHETVLSVVANKYAFQGSYTVHCFLGQENNSTVNSTAPYANATAPYNNYTTNGTSDYDFTQEPNYVGGYGILGGMGGGQNGSMEVTTEGCIPLTTALQGKQIYGEIKSLKPDDVEDYLEKHLYYKVIGPGGKEIPADEVPGLHLYVKSAPYKFSGDSSLPIIGDYIKLPRCTEKKPAGKPFTWVPKPYEYVWEGDSDMPETPTHPGYPSPSEYPTDTMPPYPTGTWSFPKPEDEAGYCVSKQTIEYVDEKGEYLYSETY